jgi:hypothetical protein
VEGTPMAPLLVGTLMDSFCVMGNNPKWTEQSDSEPHARTHGSSPAQDSKHGKEQQEFMSSSRHGNVSGVTITMSWLSV